MSFNSKPVIRLAIDLFVAVFLFATTNPCLAAKPMQLDHGCGERPQVGEVSLSSDATPTDFQPWVNAAKGLPSTATVTVDASSRLSIGGISTLDRRAYFGTHNPPRWGEQTLEMQRLLEVDWNTFPSRSMWNIYGDDIPEDPQRPGYVADSFFEKPRAGAWGLGVYLKDDNAPPRMVVSSGHYPEFMSVQGRDEKGTPKDYDAAAELLVKTMETFDRYAGRLPAYLEILNESDIPYNWAWHYDKDAWQKNCDFHNTVADAMRKRFPKAKYPEFKVGGPAQCCVRYHLRDFEVWRQQMPVFIEGSGEKMDFLAFHLYDFKAIHAWEAQFGKHDGQLTSGGRVDAVVDLIDAQCQQTLGRRLPMVVSEYGGLGMENHFGMETTPDQGYWMQMRGANSLLFDLLNLPDRMEKSVPFFLPAAPWDNDYPYNMWKKNDEGKYEETGLADFYRLWAELAGDRRVSSSSDRRVKVRTFVTNEKCFVALHSIAYQPLSLSLKGLPATTGSPISIKRIFLDEGASKFEDTNTEEVTTLIIRPDETVLFTLSLATALPIKQSINETIHYAAKLTEKITGKPQSFFIELPSDQSSPKTARLKIGLSKPQGFSENPMIKLNGHPLELKMKWTAGVPEYWSISQIEIPTEMIQASNEVSIQFPSVGGRISSVALVVGTVSDK